VALSKDCVKEEQNVCLWCAFYRGPWNEACGAEVIMIDMIRRIVDVLSLDIFV